MKGWACILGGVHFETKRALIAHIREIVARVPLGEKLEGNDLAIISDLLSNNHPTKIGSGIREIRTCFDSYRVKALYLYRTDGSSTDFSWVKLVSRPSAKSAVSAALRNEIIDQKYKAMDAAFRAPGIILKCPVFNISFSRAQAHVDHQWPVTFDALVEGFLFEEDLTYEALSTTGSEDKYEKALLVDRDIAQKWKWYHAKNAILRVISTKANVGEEKRGH